MTSLDSEGTDDLAVISFGGPTHMRFSLLAKCVKTLRKRHQGGITAAVDLNELLEESAMGNVGPVSRAWLSDKALSENPKVTITEDGKYRYKPPYDIPNAKAFVQLLRKHDKLGLGGIWLDDIKESLPRAEKVLEKTRDSYVTIVRKSDKRVVVYYNNKSVGMNVSEGLQELWRTADVAHLNDQQIRALLIQNGIQPFMDDSESQEDAGAFKVETSPPPIPFNTPKPKMCGKSKVPVLDKNGNKIRDNAHVVHLLRDYSEEGSEVATYTAVQEKPVTAAEAVQQVEEKQELK